MEENKPKWNVENIQIAILATDGKTFRKIAWIKTSSGGIFCVTASTTGIGTKLSYHVDGNLFHGIYGVEKARNQLKYPPINEIKGLQPFYGAGIGWGDHLKEFPFTKSDETVYVDIRPENKGVSFNLAFLEPHALQHLDYFSKFYKAHVHLITRTKPWIVIWTYEDGPKAQPSLDV